MIYAIKCYSHLSGFSRHHHHHRLSAKKGNHEWVRENELRRSENNADNVRLMALIIMMIFFFSSVCGFSRSPDSVWLVATPNSIRCHFLQFFLCKILHHSCNQEFFAFFLSSKDTKPLIMLKSVNERVREYSMKLKVEKYAVERKAHLI